MGRKVKAAAMFVGGVVVSMAVVALIDRLSSNALSNAIESIRKPAAPA
jgi:hypothetical protein